MYPYEGMFLVDPVQHAADPEAIQGQVRSLLEKHGAKVHQLNLWDERRLAYEIKGHKRGVYLLIYFEMPGENVDALRRESRIVEPILRQLIIRLEEDIPAHLERSARYYDKMRQDQDPRRGDRGSHSDEGGENSGEGAGRRSSREETREPERAPSASKQEGESSQGSAGAGDQEKSGDE